MRHPLRVAIVGMGGFARNHHNALRALEANGECRVVATCDPHRTQFTTMQREWDFEGRGVHVYSDYITMLDSHATELDFVTIPTPIPLHAPMHRACVERNIPCYLEKPPTLFWAELDSMLEVETSASQSTQVGFNYIIEEPRRELKRRLLDGEFGRLKRAGFVGHWPRSTSYYERASWAGRLMLNDRLVLDSCTGNAMAHYIHNLLFWCGQDEILSWGEVHKVEAELYRAHSIESFDTVFARGQCAGEIEICVTATHAGRGHSWQREWLECENATLTYLAGGGYTIQWRDGQKEADQTLGFSTDEFLLENLHYYVRYLRGEEARPLTCLEDTRPFVHLNDLFFVASGQIVTIDQEHLERVRTAHGGDEVAIQNIQDTMETFAVDGKLPGEVKLPWGQLGGRTTAADLNLLESVVTKMCSAWQQHTLASPTCLNDGSAFECQPKPVETTRKTL